MFEGLRDDQLVGAIEALLFVTNEPVGTITLAEMLAVDPAVAQRALVTLQERLVAQGSGIQLREVAGGWRLYTHPAYHELVEQYVLSWDTRRLSQAAMETLAIVAYMQPVTRAQISDVRGVNSDSAIGSLVDKGLVRESGQADAPGSPTLYATTKRFLEKFGLRSTHDLPDLDQFAPDDATRAFIRERLSAVRVDAMPDPSALDVGESQPDEDDASDTDRFATLQFDFDGDETPAGADDSTGDAESPARGGAGSAAAQRKLADAMASSFGLVEKVDFDALHFEDDDE